MNTTPISMRAGATLSLLGSVLLSGLFVSFPLTAQAAITVFDQNLDTAATTYTLPGIKKPMPFPGYVIPADPLSCSFLGTNCTDTSVPGGMAGNFNIHLLIDKAGAAAHATNPDSQNWYDYPNSGIDNLPVFSWNVHGGSDTNQTSNKTGGEICDMIDSTSTATWTTGSYNSPENNKLIRYGQVAPGNVWQIANADNIGNSYIKKLTCTTNALPANTLSASPTTINAGQSSTITFNAGANNEAQGTICTPVNFSVPTHAEYNFTQQSTGCTGGYFGSPMVCTYKYTGVATGNQVPDTSGSVVVSPTVTTTYQYNCTNGNGTTNRSVTVTVLPVVPPAATATLSASPTTITSGGSATLSWSSTNATSCTSGNFTTGGATSGSVSVSPSTTTTYSMSCTGAGGTSAMQYATVTVSGQPDLSSGTVSPTTATAGSATTLSIVVSNNGSASTGVGFSNRFDMDADADHTTVTTTVTGTSPALAASGTNTSTANYTFTAGTWYVRACADSGNAVAEGNESNNCSAWTTVSVSAPAGPNLTAGAITPTTAVAGSAVSLTSTISNIGSAATQSTFYNAFQIANDASGTGAAVIGTAIDVGKTAGQSGASTLSYTFTGAGTKYVRACADNNASMVGTIVETNEGDNCGVWTAVTITAPALPDLSAGSITPTTAMNGSAVTLSSTITNSGTASTGAGFTNLFQRASDASGTGSVDIGTHSAATLGSGATSAATLSYTFPSAGTWYVRACADKNSAAGTGTISESNEGNNCSAWTAVAVSAPAIANLTAGAITPTSAMNGSAVTLSSTITNSGTASTGATFTDVFQVANDASGTGATVIGTFANPIRTAGTSNAATLSYTFPSVGVWYVRACADQNASLVGTIAESNEGDNCGAWTAVSVTAPAAPDLTAGTITPTAATNGTAVTLSSTITNSGTASTGATFTDVFQVANDASGTGATVIGTFANPIRTAGTSNAATLSYTFTSVGTKYVRVCADNNASMVGTIAESDEGNNCSAWTAITVSAPLLPNLTAGAVTPTSATAGSAVSLSSTISNTGTASTQSTFWNNFQRASDASGTGATSIGTVIDAGKTAGQSGAATLSYTFSTPGTWYVRVCADNNASMVGTITESNEGDNCGAWTAVSVAGPNLTAGAVTPVTASLNGAVTLSSTITNSGTASTGTTFTDVFQRATSASGTGATVIGTFANPARAAGTSNAATLSYTFPSVGTWYIRACADQNASLVGTITETNESDNCGAWTAVTVTGSNLTAGAITPTTATVGTAVTLSALITNAGNGSTNATFTDNFQRATDASGTGATSIGTFTNPIRDAGTAGPATLSYTFPSAGTWYVRACADSNASMVGTITESNEGDNCGAWTAIAVAGADLTAGSVSPTSATAGSAVTLSATVTNGGSSTTGTTFTDVFQMANDASGTGATVIGTFANPIRTAGTSNAATLSYTFPSVGTKYVRVCADNNASMVGTIAETNESNNCGAWTQVNVVGVGAGIDLTAASITQSTAVVNAATSFTATISNAGTDATATTFTDVFQIANDALGSGATSIGTYTNPVLAAGSSNTASRTYTFTTTGVKYMRVCADNNASMVGTITEINEGNNCGAWKAISITNPAGAGVTSCTVSPGSVATGTPVTWTASPSGLGTYTWAPSEGGAPGGTGVSLNRSYATAGTYGMSVTAGGRSVNCPNVVVGASQYGEADPTITTSPERVVPGGTTQITVSATGVDDRCVLTGPGVNQEFVAVGGVVAPTTVTTPTINNQSTYTFTCDDVEAEAKAIVNIIPVVQEF